ncbi:MAG TPA: GAF domain-containing protein [Rhodanobacteraceae bacterium]|nr:GAF domain-containing protein [Rhodanobacteraceae bacterium]
MFHSHATTATDKASQYAELAPQVRGLLEGERDLIANAANFAALVYHALPEINWAGFYLFDGTELVVGPFQGRPACIRIALGKGVCGEAAASGESQVVADVTAHPNHIFCDPQSRSEVVVPLHRADGRLLGVWDVDSPRAGRFDDDDREGMEMLCTIFMAAVG